VPADQVVRAARQAVVALAEPGLRTEITEATEQLDATGATAHLEQTAASPSPTIHKPNHSSALSTSQVRAALNRYSRSNL
jgi:hypothetical protein